MNYADLIIIPKSNKLRTLSFRASGAACEVASSYLVGQSRTNAHAFLGGSSHTQGASQGVVSP